MTDLPDTLTAPAPPRRTRRWPWIVVAVIVAILLAGAGTAVVYAWNVARSFDEGATAMPAESVFPEASARPEVTAPEAQTILLVGSDTRGDVGDDLEATSGQRADTIMVVRIPADRESIQVVSIMRDNWVSIPGHGEAKINAALALGGMPLLVQTVEGLIDSRIDHVAIIDFEGFKGLTDALGGVTVENASAFSAGGTHFAEGPITLTGEDALTFVRERYAFPDGDYTRVRNQQAFIKGLVSAVLSRETLTDPVRIATAVGVMARYLTVDEGLNSQYLAGLAPSLTSLRAENVRFMTSPTLGTSTSDDGQSIVIVDWDGWALLAEAFRSDTLADYTPPALTQP